MRTHPARQIAVIASISLALTASQTATASQCPEVHLPVRHQALDIAGHALALPVHVRYQAVPSEYEGGQYRKIEEIAEIDFAPYAALWPAIARGSVPHSGNHHRYHVLSTAVQSIDGGALHSRFRLRYENWGKDCVNVPYLDGWNIKTRKECWSLRHFRVTSDVDAIAHPVVHEGQLQVRMETKVNSGKIPMGVHALSTILTAGLGGVGGIASITAQVVRDTVAKNIRRAMDGELGQVEGQANQQLQAFVDGETVPVALDFNTTDAWFYQSGHSPWLAVKRFSIQHFKPHTACRLLKGLAEAGA